MRFEQYLSTSAIVELFQDGFLATQLGLITLVTMLFLASFAFCILAFRAAGSAHKAKQETAQMVRSVQDCTDETRHLAAQTERAVVKINAHQQGLAERLRSVRLSEHNAPNASELALRRSDAIDQTHHEESESTVDEEDQLSATRDMVSGENNGAQIDEAPLELKPQPRAKNMSSALMRGFIRRR